MQNVYMKMLKAELSEIYAQKLQLKKKTEKMH